MMRFAVAAAVLKNNSNNKNKLWGLVTVRNNATHVVAKGKDSKSTTDKDIIASSSPPSSAITPRNKKDVVFFGGFPKDIHYEKVPCIQILSDRLSLLGILSASEVAKDRARQLDSRGRAKLEISSQYVQ